MHIFPVLHLLNHILQKFGGFSRHAITLLALTAVFLLTLAVISLLTLAAVSLLALTVISLLALTAVSLLALAAISLLALAVISLLALAAISLLALAAVSLPALGSESLLKLIRAEILCRRFLIHRIELHPHLIRIKRRDLLAILPLHILRSSIITGSLVDHFRRIRYRFRTTHRNCREQSGLRSPRST